jgi:hypothetical protein
VYAHVNEVLKGADDGEQSTFSTEEWRQVVGGAFMAGFAVTTADPSGLWGLLEETFASGRALMEAKNSASANELMKAIVKRY